MAKQSSFIKINGTIQDLTFFKSGDGHMVKAKSAISASKIKNDPKFARTRENMAEFAHAAHINKTIRASVRSLIEKAKDRHSFSRFSAKLMEVVKSDMGSDRGERKAFFGTMNILQGFEFNAIGKLGATLYGAISYQIDVANKIALAKGKFFPGEDLKSPMNSTHFRITQALLFIDLQDPVQQEVAISATPMTKIEMTQYNLNLESEVGIDITGKFGFQFILIEFFQEVNGKFYLLKNGAHNCLQLTNVAQL